MSISKFANLGHLEKLDCETPHIYVKKIEFACNYFATVHDLPQLRNKDVMSEMLAEQCFEDGNMVESVNHMDFDSDVETPMNEDSDDDVSLRNKFYPPYLKKQKAQEFIELRMEGMFVTEYYSKFIDLSRFAPEVVETGELRAQRFESGITLDLQMMLVGETFISLDTLYGKAAHLYGLHQRRNRVGEKRKDVGNQNQGGGQQNQGNFKKNKGNNHFQFKGNNGGNKNNFHNNNGNRNQSAGNGTRVYECICCHNNHPGKDCDGNLIICRLCEKLGHREFECWAKNGKTNQVNRQNNNRNNQNRNGGNNGNNGGNQRGYQSGNNNNNGQSNGKSRGNYQ
ncbi:uncharacterized protein [Spinacia oleracea]|uniref:Retrotransposon gag domain-containing protein n=1 Tax=Spinacia oleracea TaxID=3562 RepID=A0ABM3RQJ8_SPIOL|nr:uncharacterized protein LOC130471664 [Spinacia oleracea]